MEKVNITIGSVTFERHCRPDVLSPHRILEQDGHLAVTLPETSKTSAEDLAPALAAVETPAEASRRR
jgi:hypothetical protein